MLWGSIMKDFNFHWLIFKYDFKKLQDLRRNDFSNHDDDLTFRYACASVKTFINHNPDLTKSIHLWVDDVDLLKTVFSKYGVDVTNLNLHDIREEIELDKKHEYPWHVKSAFLVRHFNENSFFIDNDCICKENLTPLLESLDDKKIVLWELERQISNTRPYWGWQLATEYLKRPFYYWVANDGIIGLTKSNLDKSIMKNSLEICHDVYKNVDISSRFPDRHPKLMISQQMAVCFAAQDLGLEIVESKKYFDHFYSNKNECLKFL